MTFDAMVGQWNCQCQETGRSHLCVHRMMGMWWIFQECPGTLVSTSDIQVQDIDDLETHMIENSIMCEPHSVNTQDIRIMTEYLSKQKRIPCLQELPLKLRTQEEEPPPCFAPSENTCPYCPGPTPPVLSLPKVVTTQAVVYGIKYVKKGKSTSKSNFFKDVSIMISQ